MMKISGLLRKTLWLAFVLITGITLGFAGLVSGIGIYVSLFTPEPTYGTDVAEQITRRLQIDDLDQLVGDQILTEAEVELLREDDYPIARQVIWRTVLPIYGVYPYPATIYNSTDLPFSTKAIAEMYQPYVDARLAAVVCDLADPEDDPEEYMPKQEFDELIVKLEAGVVLPKAYAVDLNCPYLQNRDWDIYTYQSRNALLVCWKHIPMSWRQDFVSLGWSIDFTISPGSGLSFDEASDHDPSGLINYGRKTIYLGKYSYTTPIHEFVHYVVQRLNWRDKLEANFTDESPALAKTLGTYSQTNAQEFFARYTSYLIAYPYLQRKLKKLAPNTYILAQQLIDNYDTLLEHYSEALP